MNFEVIEIYVFYKAVLCKACLAVLPKVIDIDVQPYRCLKVEGVTDLVECVENLFGSVDIVIIIAYDHIAYKMIILEFFSP